KFSITRDGRTGELVVARQTRGTHVEVLRDSRSPAAGAPAAGQDGGSGEPITSRMELKAYEAMVRKKLLAHLATAREFESTYYARIPMLAEPPGYVAKLGAGTIEPQYHLFNPAMRYFEPDSGQPVAFSVNPDGAPNAQILDDIGAAMQTWSSVPGCN